MQKFSEFSFTRPKCGWGGYRKAASVIGKGTNDAPYENKFRTRSKVVLNEFRKVSVVKV